MIRYSLRFRLLGGAAIAIALALAIAWGVMTLLFARHIERRAEDELRRAASQLVASLSYTAADGLQANALPMDPRFEVPASGLYWQVSGPNNVLRSRSLWDQALNKPREPAQSDKWLFHLEHGPFERGVFVVERIVKPDADEPAVLVQVAENGESLIGARREFGRELALFLTLLWLVLSVAAWAQVSLGLRPFTRLRREVVYLRRLSGERLTGNYPREIHPLTDAINALLEARDADVRRARQRAADLAHGMKTPIAALAAQTRLIAEGGAATEGLERAISSAAAAVESELARARAAASRHEGQITLASPRPICAQLVAVLERTEKGMTVDIINEIADDLQLRIDADDLTEILGALLENAVKFARREVHINGAAVDDRLTLLIEDDGPGMDTEAAERALGRGVRLDERSGGHGLGLSIARDLVEATGGTIALSPSDFGGLRVSLVWPA